MTAKLPTAISTCEICGCQFVGRRHYQVYKACDKPECRRECRSRASKKTVWKAKTKQPTTERNCLGWCGKKFRPVQGEHFCQVCRRIKEERSWAEYLCQT